MPDQPRSAGRIKAIPLTEEDSARLRDRLLSVIEGLTREEDLDALSMRSWRESNVFASADGGASARPLRTAGCAAYARAKLLREQVARPAWQAEQSNHGDDAVVLPKVTRQRDRQHLRFVAKQPCLVKRQAAVRSALLAPCPTARTRTKGQ
jgi:hypothetical protein